MTSPKTNRRNYIPQHFQERIQEAKDKKLKKLDLSNDLFIRDDEKLTEIPTEVWELEQLEVLNLSGNQLTTIPESITKLINLTRLNLIGNQLTTIPESITKLTNLTGLGLSYNQLTDIPESISRLTNLTELDLNGNELKNIPQSISRLSNLTKLGLSGNQLKNIPQSIFQLTNLTEIGLSRNQFKSIPKSISQLTNLTVLGLRSNQFKSIPESISQLTNLTVLSLGSNQFKSIPESISQLTNLTKLDLGGNQLQSIPESISQLTNLTELDLGFNQFKNFPELITKLANLTKLDLISNQLTTIPESISKLIHLTEIYLGENQLKIFPESITKISNLTELRLKRNQLKSIPESITKFNNLTHLDLSDNQLKIFPESISQLTNLTHLYLHDNQLTTIPESITKLTNLTFIYLVDNPLETPPIEIAKKGIEAIREYIRQEKEEGIDYIYEAKLLIVGEGGAGKTTLANKIQNQNYQLRDEDTTKGIEVYQWNFQTKNQHNFQMNIWDFGGQEIYHATHQFFLTKRSLYILVADTRKEDTDFYYWLNVAELLSDNSPLLIIKNEKQERKREINQRVLQGQFTNIKEILATNLKTNRGLEEIRTEIQHHISKLPHIGHGLPKTWKKVREALETDGRNYITLTEYLSICEQNRFKKHEDKLQLIGYLHDLGVCLHFQDDPLLNKTVIIKPEWVTAAVYKALDNPKVYDNFGKFTKDDLTKIWHESKYLNMHDELLQLMIKFKLCYKIPGTSQTYIAPQLLTEDQPEYHWDENNNLILRYTYEFMPKGIITQFIVVMNEYIEEQKYVWKSGVILKKDEAKAEVIEYYGKREIKIRISGQQKRDFMTIVTHELDKIHSSYNNRLKYNKLIPCNCLTCNNNQNPHFYKFEKLNEWISNGRLETNCDNYPYDEVNIRSLIDDVIDRDKAREFLQSKHEPNDIYIIDSRDFVIDTNNNIIGNKTMTKKILNDKSRTIKNRDGNVMGNVVGDESKIQGTVTANSAEPEIEKPKKFGFLDSLTWMQNGQIIFYSLCTIFAVIGIAIGLIYPKLYPNGSPNWVEKILDIFPAPQVEKESDQK
ncbi:COR domain-containing protein [Dapis sp. BLCC M126]|uniref:leucine-rich repeat domain-containing protein n=1 Tax=Dapis sp. BLCC M126 TaxID=3400189 RepID=UPI003CE7A70B